MTVYSPFNILLVAAAHLMYGRFKNNHIKSKNIEKMCEVFLIEDFQQNLWKIPVWQNLFQNYSKTWLEINKAFWNLTAVPALDLDRDVHLLTADVVFFGISGHIEVTRKAFCVTNESSKLLVIWRITNKAARLFQHIE